MKKFISIILIVIMVVSAYSVNVLAHDYVKMYAPDGRTRETLKSEVEAYKKVGWYIEPVVKMYAPDGRTRYTLKSEVEAYKKVGWYIEPVVKMYAPDGRTRYTLKSEVEAYKKVGWYLEPLVKMYAIDGRIRYTLESEVEAYKKVGWYTKEPTVTMYAPDGRTRQTLVTEIEIYKNVGWYIEPVVKMYAPDGRTRYTLKSEVEAYKKVGWCTEPCFNNAKATSSESYYTNISFDQKHMYAIAFMGYSKMDNVLFYQQKYLKGKTPQFYDLGGDEYYLIIPRYKNTNVKIYENEPFNLDNKTLRLELTSGEPFVVICNPGCMFPSLTIEMSYNGMKDTLYPFVSLNDGSASVSERGLDITKP